MTDEALDHWRRAIDAVDDELLTLLAKRMDIVHKIGLFKKQKAIPVRDQQRWNNLLHRLQEKARVLGMDSNFIKKVWDEIHKAALHHETL